MGNAQPASSAHPGSPPRAPLPWAPSQLGTVSRSPALEETSRLSGCLPGHKAGLADTALPGASQYLSLFGLSSLVLETRNLPNMAPALERGNGG